jgi:gingipain R
MKKLIFCLVVCSTLLASLRVQGQARITLVAETETQIVVDVQLADYQTTPITMSEIAQSANKPATNQAIAVTIKGATPMLTKGAPDLPKLATTLRLPDAGSVQAEVLSSTFVDVPNVLVAPSKGDIKRSVNPADVPYWFGATYGLDAFYPSALVDVHEPFLFRDTRGVHVWIHPTQYNPVTRTLRVYKQMRIVFDRRIDIGSNERQASKSHAGGEVLNEICRRLYINGNEQVTDAQKGNAALDPEKMLILCDDALLTEIEPLAIWKRQMGIKTTVVATSALANKDTSTIAAFVRQKYQTEGIQYLLLVGDDSKIKPLMRYDGDSYSCDNCYGYLDGNDYMPEVMVGRLHATSAAELRLMVARNLEYEKAPVVDPATPWMQTQLWAASNEGLGIGDDGQADWQHANAWKTAHLADGAGNFYEFYDADHSADSPTIGHMTADQPGNPAQSSIVGLMNGPGVGVYNYTGHGWEEGLVSGDFSVDAVALLTNVHKYPILIGVACCTGHFTSPSGDCLGEVLQRAGNTTTNTSFGAIASFLSSDFQSWSPPMEGQDGMNQYLVDADGTTNHPTIGGLAVYGNARMIQAYGTAGELMAGFWNPFHEPSFVPRTRQPQQITATMPTGVFIGQSDLTVQCAVEGALVAVYFKDQTIGVARVAGGAATVQFPALNDIGAMTVTISQFNMIPLQQTVSVSPLSGPFVVQRTVTVTDQSGNQNNLADYGESLNIALLLENVGLAASTSVTATITSSDTYVQIIKGSETFGVMQMQQLVNRAAAFQVKIADSIPDQYTLQLTLKIEYGGATPYTTSIPILLHAPELQVLSFDIDDTFSGNGNHRLESGESAIVRIVNQNTGSSASPAAFGYLSCNSTIVGITPISQIGVLAPGQQREARFNIEAPNTAPSAHIMDFDYRIAADPYDAAKDFDHVLLNAIIATFDSVGFQGFAFTQADDKPWTITTVQPYEGTHCARSGVINHLKKSTLVLTINTLEDGDVSFAARVSSEPNYDFLRFYIDDVELDAWSGTLPWSTFSYPLTQGAHTLKWTYAKDDLIAEGSDAAWIDEVVLPVHLQSVATKEIGNDAAFDVEIWPNPAQDHATIACTLTSPDVLKIDLYDASGLFYATVAPRSQLSAGKWSVDLPTVQLPAGMYFVKVQGESGVGMYKIVRSR